MSSYVAQTYHISNVAIKYVFLIWTSLGLEQSLDCIILLVNTSFQGLVDLFVNALLFQLKYVYGMRDALIRATNILHRITDFHFYTTNNIYFDNITSNDKIVINNYNIINNCTKYQ